jgi:hypothetical protein
MREPAWIWMPAPELWSGGFGKQRERAQRAKATTVFCVLVARVVGELSCRHSRSGAASARLPLRRR